MGQLVDSSVLITLERRGLDLDTLYSDKPQEPLAVAAITVSELLAGIYRADSARRRREREDYVRYFLAEMPVEPFDEEIAETHARLWADLAQLGQPIGANDLLIAATAIGRDYSVLTTNLREFDKVPGLLVTQPDW